MSDSWAPAGFRLERRLGRTGAVEVWSGHRDADAAAVHLTRVVGGGAAVAAHLRRVAAVAGALRHPHLAPVDDVVVDGADAVAVISRPAGGSLADDPRRSRSLAPPEVVTLLVPLGRAAAALAGRGVEVGVVAPEHVLFAAGGRPMLDAVAACADAGTDPGAAGPALARLGLQLLGADGAGSGAPGTAAGSRLAGLLAAAAEPSGCTGAADLVDRVLATSPAAPARPVAGPPPSPGRHRAGSRVGSRDRRGARAALAVAAASAVAAAAVVGVAWGHRGGSPATVSALPARPPVPAASAAASAPAPARVRVPAPARSLGDDRRRWRRVVAALEHRRAAALAAGRADLLRDLYLPGSPAARADLSRLHVLLARGLRPRGLRPRVRAVRLLARTGRRVRLRVVDALPAYAVVDRAGRTVARAAARPARPVLLTLSSAAGAWRIVSVRAG